MDYEQIEVNGPTTMYYDLDDSEVEWNFLEEMGIEAEIYED